MKGFFFYLEYPSATEKNKGTRKNPGNHTGNVIAADTERENWWLSGKEWMISTISAVQDFPNNPVCGSSASWSYLQQNCKRISEKQAREIHPNLFAVLDSNN